MEIGHTHSWRPVGVWRDPDDETPFVVQSCLCGEARRVEAVPYDATVEVRLARQARVVEMREREGQWRELLDAATPALSPQAKSVIGTAAYTLARNGLLPRDVRAMTDAEVLSRRLRNFGPRRLAAVRELLDTDTDL